MPPDQIACTADTDQQVTFLAPLRARLRDLLAHHYYRVDALVIRRTVETPLSELRGCGRSPTDSGTRSGMTHRRPADTGFAI